MPRVQNVEGAEDLGLAVQEMSQAARSLQTSAERMEHLLEQMAETWAGQGAPAGIRGPAADGRQQAAAAGVKVNTFEDDPFSEATATTNPPDAAVIAVDVPVNNNAQLQIHITDPSPAPPPNLYPPGTPNFRYWLLDEALVRGINMWAPRLPQGTRWTTDTVPMEVTPVAGQDLNANYSRPFGLRFYAKKVKGRQFFSGASPDVTCHELGHAILDAFKPELFDAASTEVAAFHESFGDMSAMLSALQLLPLREQVLNETDGHLNVNSRLSRLAEQLGWAIRQLAPSAVDADCLRNACNHFFYQDPNNLPPSAPASQLSSEVHSFSRVFTGAFLDALARMLGVAGAATEANLLAVSQDMAQLLVDGILLAPVTSGYYSQVAAAMIQADQTRNQGRYGAALTGGFVQHGVLSPASAAGLARAPVPRRMAGAGPGRLTLDGAGNEGFKLGPDQAPTLPTLPISAFGVTFQVHVPAEVGRFSVASAALAGAQETTTGPEQAAQSFVEDLIQLDRIDFGQASHTVPPHLGPARMASVSGDSENRPDNKKTHVLVMSPDNVLVLKRRHFLCGLGCCHR